MIVDSKTKLIILPNSFDISNDEIFNIIKLPYGNGQIKQILVNTSDPNNLQLYELREIKGNNAYLNSENKRITIPKTGVAVKSFIFENEDQGQVIQSPDLIVSSKFNFFYYLVLVTYQNKEKFTKSFITYEDFVDKLNDISNGENKWIQQIEPVLIRNMKIICEEVNENGECFYKLSIDNVLKTLNNKINKLFEFLNKNELSITKKIKQELYIDTNNNEIPKKILNLSILNYSIDLIFESYLNKSLKEEFKKFNDINFTELSDYIKELQEKKKAIEIVESNMNSIITTTNSTSSKTKEAQSTLNKKKSGKQVKKVAVGKGALDGFFKKA